MLRSRRLCTVVLTLVAHALLAGLCRSNSANSYSNSRIAHNCSTHITCNRQGLMCTTGRPSCGVVVVVMKWNFYDGAIRNCWSLRTYRVCVASRVCNTCSPSRGYVMYNVTHSDNIIGKFLLASQTNMEELFRRNRIENEHASTYVFSAWLIE